VIAVKSRVEVDSEVLGTAAVHAAVAVELAAQVEIVTPGVGYFDTTALAARKHRLRVALDFFPPTELPLTRAAADPHDLTQSTARDAIAPASDELATELQRLQETFTD
jgi:hypothetical protein